MIVLELTPEQKQEYRKAWQERATRDLKKREARRQKAYAKAKKAAAVMKRKYVLDKIILFGSTVQGNFWEQSDIDLAIQGFADERRYLKLYGDLWDLVFPFKVDVILLEKVSPKVRERILREGIEL
ncbi:MAG: nucleotidyltransferase domain-containing protein [Peptococcaceae bacterium]